MNYFSVWTFKSSSERNQTRNIHCTSLPSRRPLTSSSAPTSLLVVEDETRLSRRSTRSTPTSHRMLVPCSSPCASSARENENGQLPRELSLNQSCLMTSVRERKLTSSTCSLCAKVNTCGSWCTKTLLPSSASCVLSRLSVHRK